MFDELEKLEQQADKEQQARRDLFRAVFVDNPQGFKVLEVLKDAFDKGHISLESDLYRIGVRDGARHLLRFIDKTTKGK